MNPQFSRILLATGIAFTLGACASLPDLHASRATRDRLAQVHSGQSQDQVRSFVGAPGNVTSGSGEKTWIYSYTDLWGYPSEFDVTFGTTGLVENTFSERLEY
jgi:outer membrane protein assembly factor BamE (lipoprotein component of BamABCDE complex)